MSENPICPDCGAPNPPNARACEHCNFPLTHADAAPSAANAAPEPPPSAPKPATPAEEPPIVVRRPLRRRPPRPAASQQAMSLWLFVGGFVVLLLIGVAIQSRHQVESPTVPGASEEQMKRAAMIRAEIAKDSANVDARIAMGDLLYDTANWGEAIIHYRAGIARDSSRATAIVDLGVCYYNLGHTTEAENLFQLALKRDPHQPVAWFNLGIVAERREQPAKAVEYYRQALANDPPDGMRPALEQAIARVGGGAPAPAPSGR